MEIQLNLRFFISIFSILILFSSNCYCQILTNITAESDGHRVIVKYDLENLPPSSFAKISLRFETSDLPDIKPISLTGSTLLKASSRNNLLVWDAARDNPGLKGYLEPYLLLDLVKFKYVEFLQNEGRLNGKTFGKAAQRNLLFPGLGMHYISSGDKGKSKSIVFGFLVASAVTTHLLTRSSYDEFLSATDVQRAKAAYARANSMHRIAWSLGVSASAWYLIDQISLSKQKKYFKSRIVPLQ